MSVAALDAFARGKAARGRLDFRDALSWFEQAAALAPGDALILTMLAATRLQLGHPDAAPVFEQLAHAHDLRDAWFGLAAAAWRLSDPQRAISAASRVLAHHVLPADPGSYDLGRIAAAGGYLGWCGLDPSSRVALQLLPGPMPGDGLAIELDGQVLACPKQPAKDGITLVDLPRDWPLHRVLRVSVGGCDLLGSPIDIAAAVRVEGIVQAEDGTLSGWAWSPHDPDTAPTLTISAASGQGEALTVAAFEEAVSAPLATSLSRPRGFRVPPVTLSRFEGLVHVRGRDGRDLYGSPLDPSAERRSAAAVTAALARQFPVVPAAAPEWLHPMPAPSVPSVPVVVTPVPARGGRDKRPVDVVIPVYNGRQVTLACLDSVLLATERWARVVVVDDCSSDPDLVATLNEMAGLGQIRLVRHGRNQGFPAAANTGMRHSSERDIVLLNSDTLVHKGWLRRLRDVAYSAPDIGTVTPLSNDGTIVSYPSTDHANPVPDLVQTILLDSLAQKANANAAVTVPTAVGFCTYIRRECLDEVGALREDLFAQGYGEENDFCLRAWHAGWRHVAAPGVFVAHVGSQSFSTARTGLIERNLKILNRLHPGYDRMIAEFQQRDPLAPARRRLDMARWDATRTLERSVLLVTHGRSGGVQTHVNARAAALQREGLQPIMLWPVANKVSGRDCVLGLGAGGGTPNLRFAIPGELDEVVNFLRANGPVRGEVHHLIGHDHRLLEVFGRLDIPYDVVVHDYATFCPRINLVTGTRRYCGEPAVPDCEACIADNGAQIEENIAVRDLLARSDAEFAAAARVVVPTQDVAVRMRRHFPGLQSHVAPWQDDGEIAGRAHRAPRLAGPTTVLVLGAIGIEKGYDVLLGCARDAETRGLPLRFRLVGYSMDDTRLIATGRVTVTGRYGESEAVRVIQRQEADIAFMPSVWPETWSYTLTQIWNAGLDVAAFDVGSPAERIRRTGRGWLLPFGLSYSAINSQLLAATKLPLGIESVPAQQLAHAIGVAGPSAGNQRRPERVG